MGEQERNPPREAPGLVRDILREGLPDTAARRARAVRLSLVLHLHPAQVPLSALRLSHTFCLGGLTFLLFLVEAVTGVLLMIYVRPDAGAYGEVAALGESTPFGILREIHRWGAVAMIFTVVMHMLRVFLTGAYKPPRQLNWVVGVFLLVLTFLLTFTGYLLIQDQRGFWASTVAANMAASAPLAGAEGPGAAVGPATDLGALIKGGREITLETVANFYVLHCLALPLIAALLMGWHFWRVRKDGGVGGL